MTRLHRRMLGVFVVVASTLSACKTGRGPETTARPAPESWVLLDETRQRRIPVAVYAPAAASSDAPLALLSHGHGVPNTRYAFLARALAARGFLVLSVQHQLPGDPPLAVAGDLFRLRMPVWIAGAQNLLFVLGEARRRWERLGLQRVILIGHSNGGDISALLATEHPDVASDLITLDHRRMPLPRAAHPHQLSLRAGDTAPDPGVLPDAQEQARHGIRVVALPQAKHNELTDRGPASVQRDILQAILEHLDRR
jgi:dienelactone hydrolase